MDVNTIKEFWNQQGRMHGSTWQATQNDYRVKALEEKAINPWLKGHVLNIGCGNGFSERFYINNPDITRITGIDYSEELIKYCPKHPKMDFHVGNLFETKGQYDTVLTNRCLINLEPATWQDALAKIRSLLKPGGKYVFCECTMIGLNNINEVRKNIGDPPIKIPWHNNYLPDVPFKPIFEHNFASTYYLITRGLLGECHLDYEILKDKIMKLPVIGHYAPIHLAIYQKEKK